MPTPELLGTTVAAVLTLIVYSYLLRDNPLYRIAEHLLVATGVAYALIIAVYAVLVPLLFEQLNPSRPDLLIPLVLGLMLLMKAVPRGARLGNPGLAYLVGVGLALAAGGALVGTLIPQSLATMMPVLPLGGTTPLGALDNFLFIVGTLFVFGSFLFITRQASAPEAPTAPPRSWWRRIGRWFLMITLGAIFGGIVLTFMSLLVGRWDFLLNQWLAPLLGF